MASTLTAPPPRSGGGNWFTRSEAWLDDKGKGAWIAAMVLAFILFWPIGLALLAYMIWSKRMFNTSCKKRPDLGLGHAMNRSTGNAAFDTYKAEFDQFLQDRAAARKAATAPDTVAP